MTGNLGRNQAQAHETFLLGFIRAYKQTNLVRSEMVSA